MYNLKYYTDETFKDKTKFYLIKAAIAVMNEAGTVEHHAKRVQFAHRVLTGGFQIENYTLGITTNPTIKAHIDGGTSYDSDLEFVVNSLFTAYSGGAAEEVVPDP